ncbi:MAG: hypothetical protein ACPGID_12110 [Rubricella sp.]
MEIILIQPAPNEPLNVDRLTGSLGGATFSLDLDRPEPALGVLDADLVAALERALAEGSGTVPGYAGALLRRDGGRITLTLSGGTPLFDVLESGFARTRGTQAALAEAIDEAFRRIYVPLRDFDRVIEDSLTGGDREAARQVHERLIAFKTEIEQVCFGFERFLETRDHADAPAGS